MPVPALKAKDLMSAPLYPIDRKASLQDLVDFLRENRIHGAVVSEAGRLVGVVSYSDLLVFFGEEWEAPESAFSDLFRDDAPHALRSALADSFGQALVEDIMTPSVLTCSVDDTVGKVAEKMHADNVHRLVVQDGERAVGMLSATDLLPALSRYEQALEAKEMAV